MRKRIVSALLALVMVAALLPVMPTAAAGYSKAQLDSLMSKWNAGTYAQNKNTSYGGAAQCAAFTRFLFYELWGHYDGESNTNNKLMPYGSDDIPCTTEAQLMNYLKTYAKPGDSVRLTSYFGEDTITHIMHLYDIDTEGKLSFYESNFEGNSKNKARFMVSTLKDFLGSNQTGIATVDEYGKLNRTVYLTIIHALNNTATQFSFVCSHKYVFINDNKVACEKCSAVYALPTPTDVRIYMDVTKDNAPAHSSPYRDADVGARYDKGHTVYVVGKVQNAFNNTWYKLSSGEWMVSDYLGEHYHCWSAGGFCTRCLGQGDDMKFSPIWLGDVSLKISSGGKKIPVHYAPYGDSLSFKTIKDKSQVVLDAKVINGYGNIWYRLSFDAGWIYGGYVDTYAQDAKASKEITIGYGPGPSPSVYPKQGTIPAGKTFTVYPKEVSQEGGASWVSARYGDVLGFVPSGSFTTTGSGKQVGASETPEATGDSVTSNLDGGGGSSSGGGGSSSSGGNVAQGDQNGSAGPSLIKVQYPTNQTYLDKFYIDVYKAVLVANITKQAGITVDECGIILYHADGSFMWEHKENVSHLGASLTNFHAWYDTYEELGIELEPNTTYQYQFYAIANQTIYLQPMQSFTTLPDPAETEPQAPAQYTLTFDPNGGTCDISGKTVTFDSAIGTMPVPTRDGYQFNGWYTEADGGGLIGETTRYTTQGNLTLYAHWSVAQYKLIFDANGGTCTQESQEVTYNTPLGSLPEPTRSGYTFDGWYTAAEGGNKVGAQTNYNAAYDFTVYAHWTPKTYNLIFNANGGTCTEASRAMVFDTVIGEMPVPTRAGYTFDGWYGKAEGGSLIHGQMRYNAPFDVTVYAHWKPAMSDVPADAWYADAVSYVVQNGLMSGYSTDKFGPNDTLNRAMVVQVLYNKAGQPGLNGAKHGFSDVPAGQWFNNAVTWGSKRGIVSGFGGGLFKPEDAVTVEQAAVILWNYAGKPAAGGTLKNVGKYSDWAANALRWCAAEGVLDNVPFTNATEKATRAQIAQILTNFTQANA